MSSKPNDNTTDESYPSSVEVFGTDLEWKDGRVREVRVNVAYYGPSDTRQTSENTVRFEVDETGTARPVDFEEPIDSLDDLRVLPAARTVALSVPGVEEVTHAFNVIEEQLNAGYQAVDNRLDDKNPPEDLRAGREAEAGEWD